MPARLDHGHPPVAVNCFSLAKNIMKLIIIGGVAGGASAAARARRLSEDAEIILIERGPDVSFANCGLPYHIGNVIPDRNKLLVVTPQRLRERFHLDVRVNSNVTAIDPSTKTITIEQRDGKVYTETWDKIILAPGAAPLRPAWPGVDLPGVFTLRNLQDMDRIKAAVDRGARQAVMIGGGFIGLELIENFVARGISTTLIERNNQVLGPFDKEMTTPLTDALVKHGVQVLFGETTTAILSQVTQLVVKTESGKVIPADIVVLGLGVRPENMLAEKAGLEVGPRGGIRVNEFLQTSHPEIYAVGDAIETRDFVSGDATQVPLAGPANRQGRIAADNVFGRKSRYRGTQGTAILGAFEKTVAMTGASEKGLQRSGRPYRAIYVHPADHAGYYPGAESMTLKVLFDPENGTLLGAQGVGGKGVDKRIDVLAVALQARMTVYDLEEMELCYSPQYGSAKDPVNMAGFVAAGLLRGDHPQITFPELRSIPPERFPMLIDVRMPEEFAAGHLPDAVNIPVDELRSRLGEVPRNQEIVVYCQVGQRGYLATRILLQAGCKVRNLTGGYRTYLLFAPR